VKLNTVEGGADGKKVELAAADDGGKGGDQG